MCYILASFIIILENSFFLRVGCITLDFFLSSFPFLLTPLGLSVSFESFLEVFYLVGVSLTSSKGEHHSESSDSIRLEVDRVECLNLWLLSSADSKISFNFLFFIFGFIVPCLPFPLLCSFVLNSRSEVMIRVLIKFS